MEVFYKASLHIQIHSVLKILWGKSCMFKKYFVAASAVFLLASGVANAAVSNFQFTGTVTDGGSLASIGSQITGAFSYDTDAIPTVPSSQQAYYNFGSPFGITASVEGHTVVANNLNVEVWDNYNLFGTSPWFRDQVSVRGNSVSVDGNLYPQGSFGFVLGATMHGPDYPNALTSTALPSSFDVIAFQQGSSYGFFNPDINSQVTQFYLSVDSIVVAAPVPEANTYAMFLAGLSLLGFTAYRRKNSGK